MITLYELGDAIYGERVICMCRKIKKSELIPRTKTHRGSRVTLTGGVNCVIERTFKMKIPDPATPQS